MRLAVAFDGSVTQAKSMYPMCEEIQSSGVPKKMGKAYATISSSPVAFILSKDLCPRRTLKKPLINFPDADIFLSSQPVMLIQKI